MNTLTFSYPGIKDNIKVVYCQPKIQIAVGSLFSILTWRYAVSLEESLSVLVYDVQQVYQQSQKSATWEAKWGTGFHFGVGPAECAGSVGGDMGRVLEFGNVLCRIWHEIRDVGSDSRRCCPPQGGGGFKAQARIPPGLENESLGEKPSSRGLNIEKVNAIHTEIDPGILQ